VPRKVEAAAAPQDIPRATIRPLRPAIDAPLRTAPLRRQLDRHRRPPTRAISRPEDRRCLTPETNSAHTRK
jgi:hypothetical protein